MAQDDVSASGEPPAAACRPLCCSGAVRLVAMTFLAAVDWAGTLKLQACSRHHPATGRTPARDLTRALPFFPLLRTDAIERDRTQEEAEIKRMEQQAAEALQQAREASAAAAGAAPAEAAAAAAGSGAGGASGSGAGGGGVATTLQLSAAEAVSRWGFMAGRGWCCMDACLRNGLLHKEWRQPPAESACWQKRCLEHCPCTRVALGQVHWIVRY